MGIRENVADIRRRMDKAAAEAGRESEKIILLAATKMNDETRIREAIDAGVDACGENRVQEFNEKFPLGAYEGAAIHFIGHLQKNKAKYLVGRADLIESVDSIELMEKIDSLAHARGIRQDILLEINIGGEEAKSGFAPIELGAALEKAAQYPSIRVRGLMTVPPVSMSAEKNRPYFLQMKQLFVDNRAKKYDNVCMDFLSMGMSGDFEEAIRCGANIVRVGTAIFGQRHYPG